MAAVLTGLMLLAPVGPSLADENRGAEDYYIPGPDAITLAAGRFDAFNNSDSNDEVEFRLDYRFGDKFFGVFKPFLTASLVTQGTVFLGAGVQVDLHFGERWVLTPQFSPVFYTGRTDELDLGSDYEFRSRLELAYRFDNDVRFGVAIDHTSNTGIFSEQNPGIETASFNLTIPLSSFAPAFR